MGLDLRIPVGLMFTLAGLILAGFGLVTYHASQLYAQSLGIDINLWWGLVLLAFGATMGGLGLRAQILGAREEAQNNLDDPREVKE